MWYIMSYNAVNGYMSGVFADLDNLFYAGLDDPDENDLPSYRWTGLVTEAHGFETEDAARAFALEGWGKSIPNTFMFAHYEPSASSPMNDQIARRSRDKFDELTVRLASGQVEGAELIPLARGNSWDSKLTHRERWIIHAMSRYQESSHG